MVLGPGQLGALVIVLRREMAAHGGIKRGPGGEHLPHGDAVRDATLLVQEHTLLCLDADRGVIADASLLERR
jgi:hypothetical protein